MQIKTWSGQSLGGEIGVDTETTIAPFSSRDHRLVTFQAYAGNDTCFFVKRKDIEAFLVKHMNSRLIFHNASFDISVLEHEVPRDLLLSFYDRNLIFDTKVMFNLLHLAVTGFVPTRSDSSLKNVSKKVLNRTMSKDIEVRGTFEQFMNYDIEDIPKKWLEYAGQDAKNTFDVYCALLSEITKRDPKKLLSHNIQVKGEYAIDNLYKNGIGVDLNKVGTQLKELKNSMAILDEKLAVWGWVPSRPKIRDIEDLIFKRLDIFNKLPITESGLRQRGYDALKKFAHMPFVKEYIERKKIEKTINFLLPLKDSVVHPEYNSLLNTGRISCQKPAFQTLPRSGDVRSCFVPKNKDNEFVMVDYSGIELCTVAQIQLAKYGSSALGDLINEGKDLHAHFAQKAFGKDEVTKEERMIGKIFNFGNASNMGADTFVTYAKQFDISLTSDESARLKSVWLDTFPEFQNFFNDATNAHRKGELLSTTLTGRQRNNCTYTSFLNTQFQGLASDGIKLAMFELIKKGYHVVGSVHDEVVIEIPKGFDISNIEDIMIKEMKKVVPDIRISVESQRGPCYGK